eukprot:jgi/Mesvir1/9776/Mv12227-RA.1
MGDAAVVAAILRKSRSEQAARSLKDEGDKRKLKRIWTDFWSRRSFIGGGLFPEGPQPFAAALNGEMELPGIPDFPRFTSHSSDALLLHDMNTDRARLPTVVELTSNVSNASSSLASINSCLPDWDMPGPTGPREADGDADQTGARLASSEPDDPRDMPAFHNLLSGLRERYAEILRRRAHYVNLVSFVVFTTIYAIVLFYQRRAFIGYDVHKSLSHLLPRDSNNEVATELQDIVSVNDWLKDTVRDLWIDPNCGNGVCDIPVEELAYGRFGCQEDCGWRPDLLQIVVELNYKFGRDDIRAASQWNVCREGLCSLRAIDPASAPELDQPACYLPQAGKFAHSEGNVTAALYLPISGRWEFCLLTPSPVLSVAGSVYQVPLTREERAKRIKAREGFLGDGPFDVNVDDLFTSLPPPPPPPSSPVSGSTRAGLDGARASSAGTRVPSAGSARVAAEPGAKARVDGPQPTIAPTESHRVDNPGAAGGSETGAAEPLTLAERTNVAEPLDAAGMTATAGTWAKAPGTFARAGGEVHAPGTGEAASDTMAVGRTRTVPEGVVKGAGVAGSAQGLTSGRATWPRSIPAWVEGGEKRRAGGIGRVVSKSVLDGMQPGAVKLQEWTFSRKLSPCHTDCLAMASCLFHCEWMRPEVEAALNVSLPVFNSSSIVDLCVTQVGCNANPQLRLPAWDCSNYQPSLALLFLGVKLVDDGTSDPDAPPVQGGRVVVPGLAPDDLSVMADYVSVCHAELQRLSSGLSSSAPSCSPTCSLLWAGDLVCDTHCLSEGCVFDFADCCEEHIHHNGDHHFHCPDSGQDNSSLQVLERIFRIGFQVPSEMEEAPIIGSSGKGPSPPPPDAGPDARNSSPTGKGIMSTHTKGGGSEQSSDEGRGNTEQSTEESGSQEVRRQGASTRGGGTEGSRVAEGSSRQGSSSEEGRVEGSGIRTTGSISTRDKGSSSSQGGSTSDRGSSSRGGSGGDEDGNTGIRTVRSGTLSWLTSNLVDSRWRLAGTTNRIIGGILIQQHRTPLRVVPRGKKFRSLFYLEFDTGVYAMPFGANPLFLRSSPLFAPDLINRTDEFFTPEQLSDRDVPFGFFPLRHRGSDIFPIYIDISKSQAEALLWLDYLKEGSFLGVTTEEVQVQIVTYNGILEYFGVVTVSFRRKPGGIVLVRSTVQTFSLDMYNTPGEVLRGVGEVLLILMVIAGTLFELQQMLAYARAGDLGSYFADMANLIDLTSIGLFYVCIVLWAYFLVKYHARFDIQLSYQPYRTDFDSDGERLAKMLDLAEDGDAMREVLDTFQEVQDISRTVDVYSFLTALNLLFTMFRILKLTDFHPRLGIITHTLSRAANDTAHYLLVAGVVFISFAMLAHLSFGTVLPEFCTLSEAVNTCFLMVVGEVNVNVKLVALQGLQLAMAWIFFWLFMIIMHLILINFFIAFIIDSFSEHMATGAQFSSTVAQDVRHILRDSMGHLWAWLRCRGGDAAGGRGRKRHHAQSDASVAATLDALATLTTGTQTGTAGIDDTLSTITDKPFAANNAGKGSVDPVGTGMVMGSDNGEGIGMGLGVEVGAGIIVYGRRTAKESTVGGGIVDKPPGGGHTKVGSKGADALNTGYSPRPAVRIDHASDFAGVTDDHSQPRVVQVHGAYNLRHHLHPNPGDEPEPGYDWHSQPSTSRQAMVDPSTGQISDASNRQALNPSTHQAIHQPNHRLANKPPSHVPPGGTTSTRTPSRVASTSQTGHVSTRGGTSLRGGTSVQVTSRRGGTSVQRASIRGASARGANIRGLGRGAPPSAQPMHGWAGRWGADGERRLFLQGRWYSQEDIAELLLDGLEGSTRDGQDGGLMLRAHAGEDTVARDSAGVSAAADMILEVSSHAIWRFGTSVGPDGAGAATAAGPKGTRAGGDGLSRSIDVASGGPPGEPEMPDNPAVQVAHMVAELQAQMLEVRAILLSQRGQPTGEPYPQQLGAASLRGGLL